MRADLRRRLEALEASAPPARDDDDELRDRLAAIRNAPNWNPLEPPSQEELDLMAKIKPSESTLAVMRNIEKMMAIRADPSLRERSR
jgi:hypothetical protein